MVARWRGEKPKSFCWDCGSGRFLFAGAARWKTRRRGGHEEQKNTDFR
jgi:hypothetical protein